MARSRRNQYRSSILPTLFIGGTALGLLGMVGLMVAWAMGTFDRQTVRPVDRTGQLAFPALARPVSAFEAICREHLINPQTKQLNVVWLPEATAEVASRSLGDLIGRVLSRDKEAGMVLTERDFLPAGTKPGVSAGIPPGKFAVTIAATDIPGLEQLRHGDRFDLMVALTAEADGTQLRGNTEPAAVFGGIKPPSLRVGQLSQQHGVKRLVTGGRLIALTQGKQQSTKGSSGLTVKPTSGRSATKTITYAEIAIDEEEIGPLTEAISLATPMTCIVRSGRPDAEVEEAFSREGLVPVITTATAVEAYSELTDESLIDHATGQLHFYYFPAERVPDHWLTDPTMVYGRVVSRPLRRGSPITEADLLPLGTKPGISAGVPAGMVAMAVSTGQMAGFADLVQGDRFAIHAKMPAESAKAVQNSWAKLHGGTLSPETELREQMLRTGIREVVGDAIFLREGADGKATIAVPDDRVAHVAQLIRDDLELFVVARSVAGQASGHAERSRPKDAKKPVRSQAATAAHTMFRLVSAQRSANQQDDEKDPVEVPILTRNVEAFERLSVDDFIDPATGDIRYLYFPADRVQTDWITDIQSLVDRVTNRDLTAGRAVSATDLAPQGAVPGPSAGVPVGMRGFLVDSSQIEDLDLLRPGATFAIAAGGPVSAQQLGDQVRRTFSSADAVAEADKLEDTQFPVFRPIASGAVLLKMYDNTQRSQTLTLTDRTVTRTDASGLITKEEVQEIPRLETVTTEVMRFAIAVPASQAAVVAGSLSRNRPLRAVLDANNGSPASPAATTQDATTGTHASASDTAGRQGTVNAFVREHFRGSDAPFTEVFVSDRSYPDPLPEGDSPLEAKDGSHE
ncbi:CpaB family protein [Roseimaritima ulvae]|uniref:SAF domain-containing protein n=1 Tax=Roseimaritima ulvae TaxID=980254 RepID=A0A5B9R3E4_9BACT|nr:hypothetical protein [Roseimaritima ulvae]QEG40851.1 hypothetical protein UC8_28690 [Roseimaritima ulvae]